MIISYSHKFIFIKNRKVGGSSLEKYLIDKLIDKKIDIHTGVKTKEYNANNIMDKNQRQVSGHLPIKLVPIILKSDIKYLIDNFFIFSIERNPYDKCVSSYFFNKEKSLSFENFLYHKKNLPTDWKKYTINDQIIGSVFIYGDFNKIFARLNKVLNLNDSTRLSSDEFSKYSLKKGFRPKLDSYQKYYNKRSRKFVDSIFEKEINHFGFKF